MKKKLFDLAKTLTAVAFCAMALVACETDYNEVGADILGDDQFGTGSVKFPVVAYNKALLPVQSNNLRSADGNAVSAINLGVYNDDAYGKTTYSFVTQVVPESFSPDFGNEVEINSVILSIPYFSTQTETDTDGNAEYKLDSVYGGTDDGFKLSVYENTYFLRDLDPETNLEEAQLYYSNANETINFNNFAGTLLYENADFIPSNAPIVIEEENEDGGMEEAERLPPQMRLELYNSENNPNYWEDLLILNQDEPVLSNANNFKEFFRGLYIKAEPNASDAKMAMLNMQGAKITVHYTNETTNTDEDGEETTVTNEHTYVLNLTGNRVNVLENDFTTPLVDGNSTDGDDQLFLKGGEGSMAVIDLFNGMKTDEDGVEIPAKDYFNQLFKDAENNPKRLINEANLILYVDQDAVNPSNLLDGVEEPERIYIYNLNNNLPLVDYGEDPTGNANDPYHSFLLHSQILEREDDGEGKGIRYKIRLTEHLNNLLMSGEDSFEEDVNVKLGVAVTTNINAYNTLKVQTDDEEAEVTRLPVGSFLSPEGTVLYGSTDAAGDKKIQLEIFYSEPLD